jgi:deazaflavin-dependent oxidoreductase (nitroreductase family)
MNPLERFTRRYGGRRWFARLNSRILPPIDRAVARLTGGRHTLSELAAPTLLLTTIGRKSGQERTQPLVYVPYDGGWAVVGTNFGQAHHPAWTHNLVANPEATVTLDGTTTRVRARRVGEDEFVGLWPQFVAVYPGYADYAERLTREARMFALEPTEARTQ